MKNIFTICLIIFLVSISYSQNTEVDKRNGFKDIKLGSHYTNFEGITEISNNDTNKIIGLWNTSDKDLGYFFEDKIDFFELTFDKSSKELIAIKVVLLINKPYTEPSAINKFKNIADKLITVLGNPDKTMKEILGLVWFGNKISMSFTFNPEKMDIDKDGNTIGLTSLKLIIFSNNEAKNNINKGF